jgi:hypothetical protein
MQPSIDWVHKPPNHMKVVGLGEKWFLFCNHIGLCVVLMLQVQSDIPW